MIKKLLLSLLFVLLVTTNSVAFMETSIVGGHVAVTVNTTWANYDELEDTGWAGSGASNAIIFMKGTGSETPNGHGLEAELLTEAANQPEDASGTPPSRQFISGNKDYMIWTETAAETIMLNDFLIVVKVHTVSDPGGNWVFLRFLGATNNDIDLSIWAGRTVRVFMDGTTLGETPSGMPGSGDVYLVMSAKGTDLRAGWTITKPTDWNSSFTSGSTVYASAGLAVTDLSIRQFVGGDPNPDTFQSLYVYYLLFSTDPDLITQ